MILIDLNQTIIAGLMAQIKEQNTTELNEGLIRHMVLNIIHNHASKFKKDYGNIILCSDSRKYWRKEIFPHYKANRKTTRDKSELDWDLIHDVMNKLKVELKENFPYKFMEVEGAEADDIIGVLAPIFVKEENVLIISSDNDFLQLQKYRYPYWVAADIAGYNEIYQYSPSQKKFITSTVPELDLKMKILKGDAGDGVPNILSDSECFVSGIRQTPLTQKKLDLLMESDPNKYDIATFVRWCRNKMLIDLECIPKNIQEEIINIWKFITPAPRARIVDYMVEHRLNNLMECIEEF